MTDSRCLGHEAPRGYPECRERLSGILAYLRYAGLEVLDLHAPVASGQELDVEPAPQTLAAVTALHADSYVRRFRAAAARGDALLDSADNPLSPATWAAAWAAVDATLAAADWVAGGRDRVGFAAVRPPGDRKSVV